MKISCPQRAMAQSHHAHDLWLHDSTEDIDLESIHATGGEMILGC